MDEFREPLVKITVVSEIWPSICLARLFAFVSGKEKWLDISYACLLLTEKQCYQIGRKLSKSHSRYWIEDCYTQRRSSHSGVFLGKGVLKICSKFIEIALRHGCSRVNLLHIFRTPFLKTPLGGCYCQSYTQKFDPLCTFNIAESSSQQSGK